VAGIVPQLPRWGSVSRLNWRVTLVQFLANAVVIGLLMGLLPGFELHASHRVVAVLWLAAVFGVLSALVRPALEFVFLPYALQSLGLAVVVIDAVLLALLALTSVLEIEGFGALVVGAVVAGLVGFVLDGVLGLTPPVVDDATARRGRAERLGQIAAVSERLRLMQLYAVLLQYTADLAFDWPPVRGFRARLQAWLWRPPVPIRPLAPEVKVRLLLQELGPTYVKLGQIVSSQGRALPRAWEQELAKLQSEVRPFAYEDVCAIVSGSLGGRLEDLYASFNPAPLAAASLAQVHDATTHEGRRVAVKVQRPHIHEQLRSDIRILARGAAVFERRVEWARDADLGGVVREFGSTLLRELDYTIEAYNARRLVRVLEPVANAHVPAVEAALSSDRVLTLEFIDGVKATDIDAIEAAGLDRRALAQTLVRGAVQMVMIEGFFHADPHPGNVVVELDTGRLTFLDTGMVGQLDPRQRISLARFLLAFGDKDTAALASMLRSLSQPFRDPDPTGYQREFERRIGPLIDPPAGQPARLQQLVLEALEVLRNSGYRLDPQLALAVKAVAQAEAITSALLPDADAADFANLGGQALEQLVPEAAHRIDIQTAARSQATLAATELVERLPAIQEGLLAWLDQLPKVEIPASVRLTGLDRNLTRLEAAPRLIAAAIVLTGLLIGSALAATINSTSNLRSDLVNAALIIFAVAAATALALLTTLLWQLIRPPRKPTPRTNHLD
jgi:ubiquinone biosynthesis protein